MTAERRGRFSIRTTVRLGFGLTLAIWLVAGYAVARRISDTKTLAGSVTARHLKAQEHLSTVRTQVLMAATVVRDTLLDPDPDISSATERLEESTALITRAVSEYTPMADTPAERDRVVRLRRDVEAFHDAMVHVLASDTSDWRTNARAILQTEMVPKRESVVRLSELMQASNRKALVAQHEDIAEMYAASQSQFGWTLSLALAASLGIGWLAVAQAGRLEKRLERQLELDAQSARELHDLSARLVTVQEDERRAIARELHDEVGQGLTAIKVELAVAQRTIEAAGVDPAVLSDARAITDGALHTVRDISHLLHPSVLDDLGLPVAIESYLSTFGPRHQLRAELVQNSVVGRLAPELETSLYRIAQEALTNVARHARATVCRVSLKCAADTVTLIVDDNGAGFDPGLAEHSGGGLGLIGIRERAVQFRGVVRIESAPGHGTRLTVELPVRHRPPDGDESAPGRLPAPAPVTPHG